VELLEKDDGHRVSSVAVLSGDQVVIVENRKHNSISLPAGHANRVESALEAARRELKEEAGIKLKKSDLMFVTRLTRRHGKKSDALFAAQLPQPVELEPGSDADVARWCPLDQLPQLLFNHGEAIQMARQALKIPIEQRGLLVVFEGIEGSGKSTQIGKLTDYLSRKNYAFTPTKWNSSELLGDTIARSKKEKRLSPSMFFLLHAADMVDRYESVITPALHRNETVVCDRYYYTGLVRDSLRGIDQDYNRSLYQKFKEPDIIFHCQVDPAVAVARVVKAKGLTHYGSGMDMNLGPNKEASALAYERKMAELYDQVIPETAVELDMSQHEEAIHDQVMQVVKAALQEKFGVGELITAQGFADELLA